MNDQKDYCKTCAHREGCNVILREWESCADLKVDTTALPCCYCGGRKELARDGGFDGPPERIPCPFCSSSVSSQKLSIRP